MLFHLLSSRRAVVLCTLATLSTLRAPAPGIARHSHVAVSSTITYIMHYLDSRSVCILRSSAWLLLQCDVFPRKVIAARGFFYVTLTVINLFIVSLHLCF